MIRSTRLRRAQIDTRRRPSNHLGASSDKSCALSSRTPLFCWAQLDCEQTDTLRQAFLSQ